MSTPQADIKQSVRKDTEDVEKLISEAHVSECGNADDILSTLGARHKYIVLLSLTMSLAWLVGAMPIMCSAFIVDSGECDHDINCEPNRTSLVSDFDLRGKRKYLADWTTSAFMIGMMVGSSTLTNISDKIGRRPVLLFSLVTMALSGPATVIADSIHVVTFGRFLQGVCSPGISLVVWVLGYECVPISMRSYATLIYGSMWVFGYCAIAPLAYLLTNWRMLLLACTLPCGLLAILFYFVVPESFHFLVVNGRTDAAIKWVKTAQKYDRSSAKSSSIDKMMEALLVSNNNNEDTKKTKSHGIAELLSNKILIFYILILTFLWTSDTFVYFGLSLYSTRMAGNRFWNYALSGLIELPAYMFIPPMLDKFGRKPIVAWAHSLAGASLIACVFIPNGMEWLRISLWLAGKFAISCSFMSIFVYGSEIFPTTVRNACMGMCAVVARIGGIVAPYVKLLEAISPVLPMVFFGSVALAAGGLTLLLPETKDRVLPSSLSDVHEECK